MPAMTETELRQFLARPLVAILSTARPNQSLHAVPIWFEYEDERFFLWTDGDSLKVRNLTANPNASLCIATHTEPYEYVSAEGRCTILKDDVRPRALSIARRYYGDERGAAFVDEALGEGSVLIVMSPARIRSERPA